MKIWIFNPPINALATALGVQEAVTELCTKHNELLQSFENDGLSEIEATEQACSVTPPELRK